MQSTTDQSPFPAPLPGLGANLGFAGARGSNRLQVVLRTADMLAASAARSGSSERTAEADAIYEAVTLLAPDSSIAFVGRAELRRAQRDYAGAESMLRSYRPRNASAYDIEFVRSAWLEVLSSMQEDAIAQLRTGDVALGLRVLRTTIARLPESATQRRLDEIRLALRQAASRVCDFASYDLYSACLALARDPWNTAEPARPPGRGADG